MAGAYCKFCDRRCFVERIVTVGPRAGWRGHMATCSMGQAYDRRVLGVAFDDPGTVNPYASAVGS